MNKTININLGGFFFHIDELAYQKLKRYLEAISKSLSDDPQGKNEIISDIEGRISELLSEKIADSRQVVNEGDIDEIIKIMGQPEDYADIESSYNESSYTHSKSNSNSKKLFRDGEDKFLGGVAAGIAHYFNIDVIWIRLAFLASLIPGGFGLLLYIILWILLPEARTTAEKLQMEGEPVNIDNIEKKIREEFANVSENVEVFANKASEKIKEGAEKVNQSFSGKRKKNNGLSDFFDTIGKLFVAIFKVIGKFIGILIIFISAAVILSLIIGGFSVGSLEWLNVEGDFLNYPPFFFDAVLPIWALTLCIFLLAVIPFLVLFILGLRILSSNVKKMNKTTSLTLLGIWIVALLAIIFTGIEYGTSHYSYGEVTKRQTLSIAKNDTLSIRMENDEKIKYRSTLTSNSRKQEVIIDGDKMAYGSDININVRKSNSNEAYFIVQRESRGRNIAKAVKNAEKISYNFRIENNTIVLDAFFISDFKNLWKDEEVNVIFYLPEDVQIYFDSTTKYFLSRIKNEDDLFDQNISNHHFKMNETVLECTDCPAKVKEVDN